MIADREDALYRAMIALDYSALDALLADDLTYVHSTGVVETKAEYLAALHAGLYEYGAISGVSGGTITQSGIAISSGVIDMLVGARGSAKSVIRLQHVLIWRQESGRWRLLLRQATRIPT